MKFASWARAVFFAHLLVSLIVPARLVAAEDDKAVDDYNFAAWLYNSGKYAMATESYQTFLKNHADHSQAALALGGSLSARPTAYYAARLLPLAQGARSRPYNRLLGAVAPHTLTPAYYRSRRGGPRGGRPGAHSRPPTVPP